MRFTGSGGFELRFEGAQSLDAGILVRDHVLRYEVRSEAVRRIPPLALGPADFLDEWSQLPWAEARQWVAPRARRRARLWHERLKTPAYRPREILFVRPDAGGATEVGLDAVRADLVFTVGERDGAYVVRRVRSRAPGAR